MEGYKKYKISARFFIFSTIAHDMYKAVITWSSDKKERSKKMRNAERLDGFYEELKRVHREYLPDWRFGQLMYNFHVWVMENSGRDIFYIEEPEMMALIKKYISNVTGRRVKIYFTFGDHPQFPFGRDDYVVAEGLDKKDAIGKFRKRHPDVNEGLLNCAFYYDERDFEKFREEYYAGKDPVEVIM